MKPKKKTIDTNEISKEYMDRAVAVCNAHSSIRAVARVLDISPMKLRKILITDGTYDNEMSRAIQAMHSSGVSVEDIAEAEGMTVSNVYAYLPYFPQSWIEGIEEKFLHRDRES